MTDRREDKSKPIDPIRYSVVLAMFLLVAVTTLLYFLEYRRLERRLVDSYVTTFAERLTGLETAIDRAVAYVDLAHIWADSYWESEEQELLVGHYLESLQYKEDGDFFVADARAGGAVSGVGRPRGRDALFGKEVGLAFSLLPWFRGAKAQSEAILASYFYSNLGLTSSFPAADMESLLQLGGGRLENAVSQFYTPHGGKQNNPEREPYFLNPYMDRAGNGLVVTYSWPVYEGDRFVGVLAVDIALASLLPHAAEKEGLTGRLLLVAPDGTVLADSVSHEGSDRSLAVRLPESLRGQWEEIGAGHILGRVGSYYVNARRLDSAPWVFLQIIESEALAGHLFSSQITLAVGLLVLVATTFIAYFAMRRRRLAVALAESELRYRAVYDATSEAIVIHDAVTGVILDVNSAFETMFGISQSAARNLSVEKISLGEPPYTQSEAAELMRRAVEIGPQTSEWRSRRGDGTVFWSEVSLRHTWIGGQSRVIVVARDIDRRKIGEAELARYRSELERLVQERTLALEEAQGELVKQEKLAVLGRLTATVSHDLRNPLGTIANSLFVVREQVPTDDSRVHRAVERAQRGVQRCNAIIEELLDFTRSPQQNREDIQFDIWLAETLKDFAPPSGIEHVVRLGAGVVVSIDPEHIRRCVANVLENAHHAIVPLHSDGGAVIIETLCTGNRLVVRFTDNGAGVAEEDRDKIFEPLFSTKSFGIGLGLPIIQQIMEAHGGGVLCSDGPDGGTTMEIWLPLPDGGPS